MKNKFIPIAISLLLGFFPGVWVIGWLDPAGTGGSILAFPATLLVMLLTLLYVVIGILPFSRDYGKWILISTVLVPVSFLATIVILR